MQHKERENDKMWKLEKQQFSKKKKAWKTATSTTAKNILKPLKENTICLFSNQEVRIKHCFFKQEVRNKHRKFQEKTIPLKGLEFLIQSSGKSMENWVAVRG